MKRFTKILYSFLLLADLSAAGIYGIFVFRVVPDSLGRIYASFAAKEGCSCLFIVKGPENYCKEYVRQFFGPDAWMKEESSLKIEFQTFFSRFQVRANYKIASGCRLESGGSLDGF